MEREARLHVHGHGESDHLGASRLGLIAHVELRQPAVEAARRRRDDIPVQRTLCDLRHADHQLGDLGLERTVVGRSPRQQLERCPFELTAHAGQLDELAVIGEARRHGVALRVVVRVGGRRGEAESSRRETVAEQFAHRRQLISGRTAPVCLLTHDEASDRGVPDHEGGVDAEGILEPGEVIRGCAPVPGHAGFKRRKGHALDPREHRHQVGAGRGRERGDAEAAVAGHDCRHAVEGRRAERRVPERLGVEVGVHVDETGAHDPTAGVDHLGRVVVHRADGDDLSVADADVGRSARVTGAVDDETVADDGVEHRRPCPSS